MGKQFSDQLQSLCCEVAANARRPRHIAARPSKARDQARCDRIYGGHEYDGRWARSILGWHDRWRTRGDKNIDSATDQLGRNVRYLRRTLRQAVLDDEVLAFDETEFAQALQEAIDEGWRRRPDTQEANASNLSTLREGDSNRTDEGAGCQNNEFAALHLVISAARDIKHISR
jgi:hypothetical protein